MATISHLLSQYGVLETLCSYLTGVDVVHLAATSKEHQSYITSSEPIFKTLLSHTICDGHGVTARVRVFGHHRSDEFHVGDPYYVPGNDCFEVHAKPCSRCGVGVCDNCRFHIYYELPQEFERMKAKEHDPDQTDWHWLDIVGVPYGTIEFRKAFRMFFLERVREFCAECHPDPDSVEECSCGFFDHFVGKRWLCLTCFFAEETESGLVQDSKITRYNKATARYLTERLCDCGKVVTRKSMKACRFCDGSLT